jgi:hypothetical protein
MKKGRSNVAPQVVDEETSSGQGKDQDVEQIVSRVVERLVSKGQPLLSKVLRRYLIVSVITPLIAVAPAMYTLYNQRLYQQQELESRMQIEQRELEYQQLMQQRELEYRELTQQREIENKRILEAIRDPENAADHLRLLIKTGMIPDPDGTILSAIGEYTPRIGERIGLVSFSPAHVVSMRNPNTGQETTCGPYGPNEVAAGELRGCIDDYRSQGFERIP